MQGVCCFEPPCSPADHDRCVLPDCGKWQGVAGARRTGRGGDTVAVVNLTKLRVKWCTAVDGMGPGLAAVD